MEILDVFDAEGNPLSPPRAAIDEVHRKGLWHQTFACWVVNPNSHSVLFQLRGPRNRIDPGSFDASASGHLSAGETPAEGFRELQEELGLSIAEADRAYIGKFRNVAVRGAYINHEFCHVFLAKSDVTAASLTLQAGEVSGVFEAGIEAAIALFSGASPALGISGVEWNGDSYVASSRSISLPSLCNWRERCGASRYYLDVMLAAKALLDGDELRHLPG